MYEFLDRLVNIAIPRIRDFRGISARSFDGRGNYSLGVKEQIIFPEIQYDQIDQIRGMDITISTSARTTSTVARCWKPSTFRSVSRVIAHGQDEHAHARETTPQGREEIRDASAPSSRS